MNTVDSDLLAMMDGVFADYRHSRGHLPPQQRVTVDRALWERLDSLGLIRLTGPEGSGGSGAGWREAAELLSAAARHGVRLPLAEHDLLACWILDAVGEPVGDALHTVFVAARGSEAVVPWAGESDRVVVLWHAGDQYRIAQVDTTELSVSAGVNLIGEPRDPVGVDTAALSGRLVPAELVTALRQKSALVRAIQVCAALDQAVALSVEHTASRVQFGRPLTKFQAIQHLVADAASEAALARCATEAALATAVRTAWTSPQLDFQIATARSCVGHACTVVVRNTHQVHGAIGTTQEHRLHDYTRAALAWRSECGSVQFWDTQVAAAATAAGPEGLWSLIVADS